MTGPISSDLRFPDLRFVPAESLVPHEQHDEHRLTALVQRIREQSVLKNPPVVAPLDDEPRPEVRYVVLDGANRATAARVAGLPHMVVQVVRYFDPGVQLSTWYHALCGLSREEVLAALERIDGLVCAPADAMHARAQLARREALATLALPGNATLTLHGGRDIRERNALLNTVVDTYRGRHFYRVTSDSLEDVQSRHHEVTAILVFPHFEAAEIVELARSGSRLPAGITRHLIRWRALRVNIPLQLLADRERPIEAKNQWLEDWLRDKLSQREVRFYEEPTVLFDE